MNCNPSPCRGGLQRESFPVRGIFVMEGLGPSPIALPGVEAILGGLEGLPQVPPPHERSPGSGEVALHYAPEEPPAWAWVPAPPPTRGKFGRWTYRAPTYSFTDIRPPTALARHMDDTGAPPMEQCAFGVLLPHTRDAPYTRPSLAGVTITVHCDRCGITQTSERRRGPNGRRTLCNKCGLKWSRSEMKRTTKTKPPSK
jgi:hypothetical protein